MCGRYSLDADIDILIDRYKAIIKNKADFKGSKEVFPTNIVPIIRDQGGIQIEFLKWGFMPTYAKSPLINARVETVDLKSTFKDSFRKRRCIIPVTSFFEWEKFDDKKVKKKIWINEEKIFSLAGIYNTFLDKQGERYEAFTILTTEANTSMKNIHDRMPVVIPKEYESIYLNNKYDDMATLMEFLNPWKTNMIIE